VALFLYFVRPSYGSWTEVLRGGYIEAWGTVIDILVVGFILGLFTVARKRKQTIDRYLEEIDDFKRWDSKEARLRIAGNIRRLDKLGKTDIDFSGLVLRDFSFSEEGIRSLKGSIFSHPHIIGHNPCTCLENVKFIEVDCQNVIFSTAENASYAPLFSGKNLSFVGADLSGARFDSAKLIWTKYEADALSHYGGEEPEYVPAFAGADLKNCSFRHTKLEHADFREAQNVDEADFTDAIGLETCFFDEDVRDRIGARHKTD